MSNWPKNRISDDHPSGRTWAEWFKIVEFTKEVDYNCQFNCNGQCKTGRRWDKEGTIRDRADMLCCKGCEHSLGFGTTVPPEAVEEVEALYDEKNGFWSSTGCRLPEQYKSATCLCFQCDQEARTNSPNDVAWNAYIHLINGPNFYVGTHMEGKPVPTIDEVRELMRGIGRLREQQLVTIS